MSPVERLAQPYQPAAADQTNLEARVAATIRSLDHLGPAVQSHVVAAFGRMLSENNPNFDAQRFAATFVTSDPSA